MPTTGVVALPFFYPTNYIKNLDGDVITCDDKISPTSLDVLPAVQGIMSEEEFDMKLNGTCFGRTVQKEDPTSNCDSCIFPYWSSPSLTQSFEMLALSKFEAIISTTAPLFGQAEEPLADVF